MGEIPGYVTVAKLAQVTGLTQATIRYHCRRGTIEAAATRNMWLIPIDAADQFVRSVTGRAYKPSGVRP